MSVSQVFELRQYTLHPPFSGHVRRLWSADVVVCDHSGRFVTV